MAEVATGDKSSLTNMYASSITSPKLGRLDIHMANAREWHG